MSDNNDYRGEMYQHDVQQVSDDASDIQAQLKKMREDLTALAATVTAIGKEKAARVANDAIEASQNAVEGVRSDYVSLEQAVAARIRARPIQAIGVAVGLGYLVAAMRRR